MAIDRITEEIAHFAGLFHLEAEAAKLRLDYEAFRIKGDAPILDPLKDAPFSGVSELVGKKLNIGPSAKIKSEEGVPPPVPEVVPLTFLPTDAPVLPVALGDIRLPDPKVPSGSDFTATSKMIDILPNSIVMAVQQLAVLSDDDLLIVDGSATFVEQTRLEDLDGLIEALSPIASWSWNPASGDASGAAMKMAVEMKDITAPDIAGAEVTILRGSEASGTFVDGALVDEAPALKDLMPAFLKPDEEVEEEEAAPVKSDGVTDSDVSPFAVDAGHHVVSGANRVINETVLKSVWVDAPVIAVAEDVVRLDIISQVNLRIESAMLPAQAYPGLSNSINIAQLEQTASDGPGDGASHANGGKGDELPSMWNVTRVDGDLMLMNWVQQHILVSDYDRIEVQFSGAATYIGTGENLVFNETLILNLGFHYDLILIGGSLVTLNQITQVNVLLDQDTIGGDLPLGAKLNAGDNLQANSAAILTTGMDTLSDMAKNFDKALSELEKGAETITAGVAQDALFAGVGALNVLYISGDLIQTSVIEQVNYLGDSDQIHFIADMIKTADGAEVSVTSGSNAQINAASVIVAGLDSTVMAGGEVYSDAVIYQAELIDECAPPTGVQIGGLVSEAVAFLAEDMIDKTFDEDGCAGLHGADGPGTADVMQTMLS